MKNTILGILFVAMAGPFTLLAATPADVIFIGGNIVTSNILRPEVEALATSKGRILAVGDLEDVLALKGNTTEIVELNGRALLPGFVGAHTHPVFFTQGTTQFNVRPGEFRDFDEMIAALKIEATKGDVVAFGYDGSLVKNSRELGFEVLDQVSTKHSVIVIGLSSHEAYGNHLAFERAGITEATPDPVGGSLVRDASGHLTGAGLEVPGAGLVLKGDKSKVDYAKLAKESLQIYAKAGFTTITVTGLAVPLPDPMAHYENIRNAALAKDAPVRVQGYVVSQLMDHIPQLMEGNNDRFRVLGVKIWIDGSIQGHTALLEHNYADKNDIGKGNYSQEAYNKLIARAHNMGLQIASHANGDRAVRMTFEAIEAAQRAHHRDDARHRIEHFTVTNRDALKRAKIAGITPTFLNQHIYEWGHVFTQRLGSERVQTIDPAGSAERLGMNFSFHDDAPTGLPEPLKMIQIAVTREMRHGGILNADERIPVDRAIRAVTLDTAWQSFTEQTRGSLEPGKYADLVILSGNPRKSDAGSIMNIVVLETWLEGKRVYIK